MACFVLPYSAKLWQNFPKATAEFVIGAIFVLFLHTLRYTTMRQLLLLLGFVLLLTGFSSDNKLVKKKIDDQVSMRIPADFTPIPQEALVTYYGMYRFPLAAYSGASGQENLFVNKTTYRWGADADLNILKSFYKSSVLGSFYKVEFLSDTIITINKREYIALEYIAEMGKTVGNLETDTTRNTENRYNQFARTGKRYYSYRLYTLAEDKAKETRPDNKDQDQQKKMENEREKQKIVRTRTGEGSMLPEPKQDAIVKNVNKSRSKVNSENMKVFIFDFSCPEKLQEQWQETAHEIMGSIKIK